MPFYVFVMALIATTIAVVRFLVKRARYGRWNSASGLVVELIPRRAFGDQSVTLAPRVSFPTASGETVVFVSAVSSFPVPAVGVGVDVLYDPSNPYMAVIDRFLFKHLEEIVVFAFGSFGVLFYVLQRVTT